MLQQEGSCAFLKYSCCSVEILNFLHLLPVKQKCSLEMDNTHTFMLTQSQKKEDVTF